MRLSLFLALLALSGLCLDGCAMTKAAADKGESSSKPKKKTKGDPDGEISMEELEVGSGPKPKEGQTVFVHYVGHLKDGHQFDSSYERGKPFEYKLGAGTVVKGWEEALPEMQVGGKYKVIIPPNKGYGKKAQGDIPPNSTLIFEMELLKIKKK